MSQRDLKRVYHREIAEETVGGYTQFARKRIVGDYVLCIPPGAVVLFQRIPSWKEPLDLASGCRPPKASSPTNAAHSMGPTEVLAGSRLLAETRASRAYFEHQSARLQAVALAQLYRWAGRICLLGAVVSGSVEIFNAVRGDLLSPVTLRSVLNLSPHATASVFAPMQTAIELVVNSPLWVVLAILVAIPYALAIQLFIKGMSVRENGRAAQGWHLPLNPSIFPGLNVLPTLPLPRPPTPGAPASPRP